MRAAALVLALLLVAASPTIAAELTRSVAISMKEAVEGVGRAFTAARPGVALRHNLGGSGELQKQIEAGAPVDIFIPAGQRQMDELRRRALIVNERRRVSARNVLVAVTPADSRGSCRPRTFAVSRGEVDIGFVYASDLATRPGRVKEAFRPPDDTSEPVVYPVAVLTDAREPRLARAFVDLLTGAEGQAASCR